MSSPGSSPSADDSLAASTSTDNNASSSSSRPSRSVLDPLDSRDAADFFGQRLDLMDGNKPRTMCLESFDHTKYRFAIGTLPLSAEDAKIKYCGAMNCHRPHSTVGDLYLRWWITDNAYFSKSVGIACASCAASTPLFIRAIHAQCDGDVSCLDQVNPVELDRVASWLNTDPGKVKLHPKRFIPEAGKAQAKAERWFSDVAVPAFQKLHRERFEYDPSAPFVPGDRPVFRAPASTSAPSPNSSASTMSAPDPSRVNNALVPLQPAAISQDRGKSAVKRKGDEDAEVSSVAKKRASVRGSRSTGR